MDSFGIGNFKHGMAS